MATNKYITSRIFCQTPPDLQTPKTIQVYPVARELETLKHFLGTDINSVVKLAMALMVFQLVPGAYDPTQSKSYNEKILSWYSRQARFIFKHAGFRLSKNLSVRNVLFILQRPGQRSLLWDSASKMLLVYLQSEGES